MTLTNTLVISFPIRRSIDRIVFLLHWFLRQRAPIVFHTNRNTCSPRRITFLPARTGTNDRVGGCQDTWTCLRHETDSDWTFYLQRTQNVSMLLLYFIIGRSYTVNYLLSKVLTIRITVLWCVDGWGSHSHSLPLHSPLSGVRKTLLVIPVVEWRELQLSNVPGPLQISREGVSGGVSERKRGRRIFQSLETLFNVCGDLVYVTFESWCPLRICTLSYRPRTKMSFSSKRDRGLFVC